jgi:hypothetical protein
VCDVGAPVPQVNDTACPWHSFRDNVVAKGVSAAALREHGACLRAVAAANPVTAAAAAGVAVPLALVLCSGRGRRAVLASLDTALATVLLICLLGVVLGLPVGAAYLMWVAGDYLLRFVAECFGMA